MARCFALIDEVDDLTAVVGPKCQRRTAASGLSSCCGSPFHGLTVSTSSRSAYAVSASAGNAATCSNTASSGMIRYTYRPSRSRMSACMSWKEPAVEFSPVRRICSALPSSLEADPGWVISA